MLENIRQFITITLHRLIFRAIMLVQVHRAVKIEDGSYWI